MEISILLLTYNHERYVRQALDSILMQKISVPYEIIVLDDASTDGTSKILREYKKKYPQLIHLYIRKVNCEHPTRNGYFMWSKATGRYFANIEGDDFWIDEYKVQKQYDFLEKHREYSACVTDFDVVDEENNKIDFPAFEIKENQTYTLEDFRHLRSPGRTVSFFARNFFDKKDCSISYKADRMMGDITIYMLCLLRGSIYQFREKMAAYRYVSASGKGNFNSIHLEDIYKDYMLARYWIRLENYVREYEKDFSFAPMADVIGNITAKYQTRAVLQLLGESENKKKYLLVFLIYKLMLDSHFLLEDKKYENTGGKYSWNAFRKDNTPVILFGSGAVATEYIDKFAWQGNIRFLVDNDKKKQNTSFKGFLIKEPEEIVRYRKHANAKILVVNREHEAEIGQQLQEMGINDYYCYCSMQTQRVRNKIGKWLLKMISKD